VEVTPGVIRGAIKEIHRVEMMSCGVRGAIKEIHIVNAVGRSGAMVESKRESCTGEKFTGEHFHGFVFCFLVLV